MDHTEEIGRASGQSSAAPELRYSLRTSVLLACAVLFFSYLPSQITWWESIRCAPWPGVSSSTKGKRERERKQVQLWDYFRVKSLTAYLHWSLLRRFLLIVPEKTGLFLWCDWQSCDASLTPSLVCQWPSLHFWSLYFLCWCATNFCVFEKDNKKQKKRKKTSLRINVIHFCESKHYICVMDIFIRWTFLEGKM